MHYYKFNIGDYRRDTAHLSHLEHGIYRALIDSYMLDEKPLSADIKEIERKHMIRTSNEKKALRNVLSDFFIFENEGFFNARCDEVISSYNEKSLKASKSAKVRWEKDASALRTDSEQDANHKPLTINHKPLTNKHTGRMARPTSEELIAEFDSRVMDPHQQALSFVTHYESNGWKVGKNPMKSWKHAVTNWITRGKADAKGKQFSQPARQTRSERSDQAAREYIQKNGVLYGMEET